MNRTGWLPAFFLAAVACFEDPITQQLQLEFREKGELAIDLKIRINTPENTENRTLQARVRAEQDRLLHGSDEWSRRFEMISPQAETVIWHKNQGRLSGVERHAIVDPDELSRFFADTAISINLTRGSEWTELTLYAGKSRRATLQQQSLVSRQLDQWCSTVSAYLSSLAAVYRYLDDHPQSAEAMLGAVLSDAMTEEDRSKLPNPSEDEQPMVEDLQNRMGEVWSILVVGDDEAFSLNELSSLVFDPFPANLTIRLPGRILEHEGFDTPAEKTIQVPRLTLWDGVPAMRDRWITPDPLVTRVESSRTFEGKPVNLQEFLAQPRRVRAVPSPAEVKTALTDRLQHRPTYRVRWSEPLTPGPSPRGGEGEQDSDDQRRVGRARGSGLVDQTSSE